MEDFKITGLLEGRPESINSLKEKQCYDILDELDIEYQRVEYNFFPSDINDLNLIDKTLEVEGIKNLIFRTKDKTKFYYFIIPRDKRFEEKEFRNKYQLPKLTMAKGEDLEELLNTYSGAVSIMELINDTNNIIKLYIDESVLNKKYFRFHPNENTSTVRIKIDDLINKVIPYLKHDINIL